MRLQLPCVLLALLLNALSQCLSAPPAGPPTLEDLLGKEEAAVAAKPASGSSDQSDTEPAWRPQGTLARPKDGVQHPDLDKAWADYDAVIAKASEGIKAAITQQFDAATSKGDLDAAEKWQGISEKFENTGELPETGETSNVVSRAVADYEVAGKRLAEAYEKLVKDRTVEKNIAEARAARDEARAVVGNGLVSSARLSNGQQPSLFNKALRFDEQSGYVTVPHVALDVLPVFTVESWVKDWQGPLFYGGKEGDPENGYWIGFDKASCLIGFEFGTGQHATYPPIAIVPVAGVNHFAWVYRGGDAAVYLNGKMIDRRKLPAMGPLRRDRPLLIGTADRNKPLRTEATGFLCALRVSSSARYTKAFTPPREWPVDRHTVVQFRAENSNETLLLDESLNKAHASLENIRVVDLPMQAAAPSHD